MWVATKTGFMSIVQHRDNETSDTMLARARLREDLERAFPKREAEIVEDPLADYRWRLAVPRTEVSLFMLDAVDDIDYDSHVKEVLSVDADGVRDRERYDAYLDVWSALYRLQEPASRYGRSAHAWDETLIGDYRDVYDPLYGDDRICYCGHQYWAHFWADDNRPSDDGCTHCNCVEFEEDDTQIDQPLVPRRTAPEVVR